MAMRMMAIMAMAKTMVMMTAVINSIEMPRDLGIMACQILR